MSKISETTTGLSLLHRSWTVAELKIHYNPKKRTGVFVSCSADAYKILREMWDNTLLNFQEQFCALFLNQSNEVIGFRVINTGKVAQTTVDINFVFSCAMLCRATTVIVAHNHPSGNLKPGDSDRLITHQLKMGLSYLDIGLLDHLIITERGYFSFKEQGYI